MGVLSRENLANSLPISAGFGKVLQILVENQGRINFEIANDFKGIIGDVLLDDVTLKNWNITGFPFDNSIQIDELIAFVDRDSETTNDVTSRPSEHLRSGPMIFQATFDIDQGDIADTFVNLIEWGKVCYLFINQIYPSVKTFNQFFCSLSLTFSNLSGIYFCQRFQFG